jgi:putative transcriptional regulator
MDRSIDELSLSKESLAKNMVGEIVLSNSPENVIKKWRNIFKISQKALANELGITSSVVSDYESGRRKSPGIKVIKKYVNALIKIDSEKSGQVIKSFVKTNSTSPLSSAIIDIKEFSTGISMRDFCKKINAIPVAGSTNPDQEYSDHEIYGYTIVDSLKAITELSFTELIKLYGITTQRAMIFTKVSTGKTPMVAIKLTNLRPGLVVLHGLSVVDDIAKRIAKAEGIPLAVCRLNSTEDITENLSGME